jgi:hypothetical protein
MQKGKGIWFCLVQVRPIDRRKMGFGRQPLEHLGSLRLRMRIVIECSINVLRLARVVLLFKAVQPTNNKGKASEEFPCRAVSTLVPLSPHSRMWTRTLSVHNKQHHATWDLSMLKRGGLLALRLASRTFSHQLPTSRRGLLTLAIESSWYPIYRSIAELDHC